MSKAKELFEQWLDLKNETNRLCVRAMTESNVEKLEHWHTQLNHNLEHFIKKSREIFTHDEHRLLERNDTIKYLQDKLAERPRK